MSPFRCTCTNGCTCTSNSLLYSLSTTQTAATAQHKVKQRLTRRAGIASYWRDCLKLFGGVV